MSDEVKSKNFIVEKFHEFRGEFRKIVWPDRPGLFKSTATVITISLIFGALITVMDFGFSLIFTNLVGLL
jgi:preprotein translocase subunit SecE